MAEGPPWRAFLFPLAKRDLIPACIVASGKTLGSSSLAECL